jgi:hypothetical protein
MTKKRKERKETHQHHITSQKKKKEKRKKKKEKRKKKKEKRKKKKRTFQQCPVLDIGSHLCLFRELVYRCRRTILIKIVRGAVMVRNVLVKIPDGIRPHGIAP